MPGALKEHRDAAPQPMKPDTRTAMRRLIAEVRAALPFDDPDAQACTGDCGACPLKLLEHLDDELGTWERRLDAGETPTLGDLSRLAAVSRSVHALCSGNR